MSALEDTIVAISTPPGRGGIGVVRLSGSASRRIADRLLKSPPEWRPWTASLAELVDNEGPVVDQVVATFFDKPPSYTGETVVEISFSDPPVVLRLAVERAIDAGARLARPGEFTLRAFLNGRIDLPRAEAVRDLIEATTLYQARIAAQQVAGSVSRRLAPIKEQLLELIALLEAGIDFAEDDVSVAVPAEILRRLLPVRDAIAAFAASFAFGKLVHDGMTLAIVGRPNVGKSSLFNRLLEQERAIVTDIPGTTRDLVSETASIGGIPVKLVDTAGIRHGGETIESLGIERSFQAMADADLTLVVIDLSMPFEPTDRDILARAQSQGKWLLAGNKSDLTRRAGLDDPFLAVSAQTGEGIEALRAAIIPDTETWQESGFITSIRHQRLLEDAVLALDKAKAAAEDNIPHEMLLLDLYSALRPLDEITGATTADDILNRIFTTFCIGK